MAEKLDDFDWEAPKHRRPKYPYSEWLDGDTWALTEGEDFDSKMATMIDLLRQQCRKRDLELDYHKNEETGVLVIRAIPNPRSQHAE